MHISIELQYLHTSVHISFSLSEYDSSVFSVGTSPANYQIYAIYFCRRSFGILFLRGAGRVQCSVCKFFALRCGALRGQNLGGVGAVQ